MGDRRSVQEVTVSWFKAHLVAALERVRQSSRELAATRRGRPIARVVPVEAPPSLEGA